MTRLQHGTIPSPADLGIVIAKLAPDLSRSLREAENPTTRVLVDSKTGSVDDYRTETRSRIIIATAEWTWSFPHLGEDMARGATVAQVTTGGRRTGEGWAETSQYLIRRPLTQPQAETVAGLLEEGIAPELISRVEL